MLISPCHFWWLFIGLILLHLLWIWGGLKLWCYFIGQNSRQWRKLRFLAERVWERNNIFCICFTKCLSDLKLTILRLWTARCDENSKEISELLRLSNILDIYSNDCVFFLSCVFYKRPIHSGMAKEISKRIEGCHICSSRSPLKSGLCEICEREGFFKSEACKRCESHTTQLFCEVKTTRNLCLKCQDFTEKVDSLIQTKSICAKTAMCLWKVYLTR